MKNSIPDKLKIIINVKEEVRHESLTNRLVKLLIDKKSRNIYITHNELAFELDSAREVVSRKLKELEKRGYLKLSRGKITIEKDLNEKANRVQALVDSFAADLKYKGETPRILIGDLPPGVEAFASPENNTI